MDRSIISTGFISCHQTACHCDGNDCAPPSAKRRGGVGGDQQTRCQRSKLIDPPPQPLPATRKSAWREGRLLRTTSRSRGMICPRFAFKFPPSSKRGRRECRAPDAPDSRVCNDSERRTRVSQVTPEIARHSPRNGFNGFLRALLGDRAFLPPSPLRSLLLKNLTPASGRQDHTTSPSASTPFVIGASASTASRPASVTIASRPSVGTGQRGYTADLGRAASMISENQKSAACGELARRAPRKARSPGRRTHADQRWGGANRRSQFRDEGQQGPRSQADRREAGRCDRTDRESFRHA